MLTRILQVIAERNHTMSEFVALLLLVFQRAFPLPDFSNQTQFLGWWTGLGEPAFTALELLRRRLGAAVCESGPVAGADRVIAEIQAAGEELVELQKIDPEVWKKILEFVMKILPLILPLFVKNEE